MRALIARRRLLLYDGAAVFRWDMVVLVLVAVQVGALLPCHALRCGVAGQRAWSAEP